MYLEKRCAAVIEELRALRGSESASRAARYLEERRKRWSDVDDVDEGERAAEILVGVLASEDREAQEAVLRVHCPVLEDRMPMLLSRQSVKRQRPPRRRGWSVLDGVNMLGGAALFGFGDSGLWIVALVVASLLLFLLPRQWNLRRVAPLLFMDAHLAVAWQNVRPWMTSIALAACIANAVVFFLGPTEDKEDASCC